jgi:hypothetical protein
MSKNNTSQYVLKKCEFDAVREFPNGGAVDLKAFVGEITFYESLLKPYLTCNIAMIDDKGFLTKRVRLQGSETIEIEIDGTSEEESKGSPISLKMRVVKIVKQDKVNDKATGYVIHCMSESAFNDAFVKVNKSYHDNLEDIGEKILHRYLDVSVVKETPYWNEDEKSDQGPVKLIVPYLSPYNALEWVMDRATGPGGAPFFAFTSIWDTKPDEDTVRFGSFKTMVAKGINKAKPDLSIPKEEQTRTFYFNQIAVNSQRAGSKYKRERGIIKSMKQNNIENTLRMVNLGAVGSQISNLDPFTSSKIGRHHNLTDYLEFLVPEAGSFSTIIDPEDEVKIEGVSKKLSEHNARAKALVTSYGTYGWNNSYHDVRRPQALMNKSRKATVVAMMYKNKIDCVINGFSFATEELRVGDVINIVFDIQDVEGSRPEIDNRRSGFYMILEMSRTYIANNHEVVVSVCKVADHQPGQ